MRELFRMDRQNYNPEGKVYRRPSARAVILKDGKVLLNYVKKFDCYEFPGGGIESGETPEQAVCREVAEETGRIVIPESVREFGIVIRRQQDSNDPDGIFEQDLFIASMAVCCGTIDYIYNFMRQKDVNESSYKSKINAYFEYHKLKDWLDLQKTLNNIAQIKKIETGAMAGGKVSFSIALLSSLESISERSFSSKTE